MAKPSNIPVILVILIAVQAFCAVVFAGDLIADILGIADQAMTQPHLYLEGVATISLIAAIGFEVQYLLWLLRRKAHLENTLRIANSAIHEVIDAEFGVWRLTPAERDVATFLVKGLSTPEIAALRGSAEGTVKAQLNSIYRKSGTRNRAEMLSILIDMIMGQPKSSGARADIPPSRAET